MTNIIISWGVSNCINTTKVAKSSSFALRSHVSIMRLKAIVTKNIKFKIYKFKILKNSYTNISES
jgi:hypothetical protein